MNNELKNQLREFLKHHIEEIFNKFDELLRLVPEEKDVQEQFDKSHDSNSKNIKWEAILIQKNSTILELIKQIEQQRFNIQQDIIADIDQLICPFLDKIKMKGDSEIKKLCDLIQYNLEKYESSFPALTEQKYMKLTKKERQICLMIKKGLSSKEISQMLNIATATVNEHRNKIRKKLDLVNSNHNLGTCLNKICEENQINCSGTISRMIIDDEELTKNFKKMEEEK